MSTDNKAHTPGPWHANTPLEERYCTDVSIREPVRGDLIATVAFGKANARLIAAAPDLLAALVEIEQHAYDDDTPQADILADFDRMRDIARAAIAKARGEPKVVDLMAALKESCERAQREAGICGPCEERLRREVCEARDAIAKARGE